MIYRCRDERRREAVRRHSTLNGLDYLEVVDLEAATEHDRQRFLRAHFVKSPLPGLAAITADNVVIVGGERVTGLRVLDLSFDGDVLVVEVDRPGDFSVYTLRLVEADDGDEPLAGLDPRLAEVEFSFKVECHNEFDCRAPGACPSEARAEPDLEYLAKDYSSLRRLMLDRLSILLPRWTERHEADAGVTLVELLAYVGDYLSYQQDAIATEAYLGTAHRRVSVRRHARLVDYHMHDGCNARAWVQLQAGANGVIVPPATRLLTRVEGMRARIPPGDLARALSGGPQVFETMHEATLFTAHNKMRFYTWGALECCLPRGATRATLVDHLPDLRPGDVLIFEEVRGPRSGQPEDADPFHRHAVRLIEVTAGVDPLGGRFTAAEDDSAVDVTQIAWAVEDALPFPLCISSRSGNAYFDDVSVALGNIVLADHGLTLPDEILEPVPSSSGTAESPRFAPRLARSPLTHAAPLAGSGTSASALAVMQWRLDRALPAIQLRPEPTSSAAPWHPQQDLLNSGPGQEEFVVEVDDAGTATLRFGDDVNGRRPPAGTRFHATYRIGNGSAGNLGAQALVHVVSGDSGLSDVRNPLPALGGTDPESPEHVRQHAPSAFRTQERAVTREDYARAAERHRGIQRATAGFRWTGSWPTVFVTVDRLGGAAVDPAFEAELTTGLDSYRMAGQDLEIDDPLHVSLELELAICVRDGYYRTDVEAAVREVFSNRILPDGSRGLFHSDNFTFGQPVYLSPLYAAARSIPGVDTVDVVTFQRQGIPGRQALDDGKLTLGPREIARLDNDPNFPERGILRITLAGGM